MKTFDAEQHPRSATGKFDTKTQTPPEGVALTPAHTADLTQRISDGEYFKFTNETPMRATDVVPGAETVGIQKNGFGTVAWLHHADIDMNSIYFAGTEGVENREPVADWLDDNSDAVHAFWVEKNVSIFGGAWDAQRPTITAYLPEGEPVTVTAAGSSLESSPGLTYLRTNVDAATSTIPADLMAFVAAYEPDDDDEEKCSECGASLDDGEGYDGLCGNCADVAESEGRWS